MTASAQAASRIAGTCQADLGEPEIPQVGFDDLYSAVYRMLDDAKAAHAVVKLYKGSHGSADPHPRVLDFGEFFYRTRRGLLAYASSTASQPGLTTVAALEPTTASTARGCPPAPSSSCCPRRRAGRPSARRRSGAISARGGMRWVPTGAGQRL